MSAAAPQKRLSRYIPGLDVLAAKPLRTKNVCPLLARANAPSRSSPWPSRAAALGAGRARSRRAAGSPRPARRRSCCRLASLCCGLLCARAPGVALAPFCPCSASSAPACGKAASACFPLRRLVVALSSSLSRSSGSSAAARRLRSLRPPGPVPPPGAGVAGSLCFAPPRGRCRPAWPGSFCGALRPRGEGFGAAAAALPVLPSLLLFSC